MYSRWPQVGEPCLHPPPTPKLALAPWCTIHPPPVRKSHGGSVSQALACGAVAVPTASTAANTTSAPAARPDASLQILFALSLICAFSFQYVAHLSRGQPPRAIAYASTTPFRPGSAT